jgi:hypothetical protein
VLVTQQALVELRRVVILLHLVLMVVTELVELHRTVDKVAFAFLTEARESVLVAVAAARVGLVSVDLALVAVLGRIQRKHML